MKILYFVCLLLLISCRNDEEMTGKTGKGDLMSPCVGVEKSPCGVRFNPNENNPQLKKYIV